MKELLDFICLSFLNDFYSISNLSQFEYVTLIMPILFTLNYVKLTDMFDMQSLSLATVKYPR